MTSERLELPLIRVSAPRYLYSLPMELEPTENPDLAHDLGAVLARLYGVLRRSVLPGKVSVSQALALSTLRDVGPLRITDLATIEGVRQPTCTAVVNTLEAKGWVERRVDPDDRRAVLVRVTQDGLAVLKGLTEQRASVLGRQLRDVVGLGPSSPCGCHSERMENH